MNSRFLKPVLAMVCAGLSVTAFAQPQLSTTNATSDGTIAPPAGSVVLYDQTGADGASSWTSQNFGAANDGFDNQIADDFFVADNVGWAVTSVFATGLYFNGAGPADDMNIFIYEDAGGAPGDVVCEYLGATISADNAGAIQVDLPSECNLPGGATYWLSAQASMLFGVGGQWGWTESSGNVGAERNWQNPPGGFGIPACTSYQPSVSVCGLGNVGLNDVSFSIAGEVGANLGPRATFFTTKSFNDGNSAEVDVEISCNTGLPLSQPATISEGDPVDFVVVDFENGELDCTVSETTGAAGYTVSYFNGTETSEDGCVFEGVGFGQALSCQITNMLDQVEVDVTKEWIDENPQFDAINIAEALWSCTNVADLCDGGGSCNSSGGLDFYGNPGVDSFYVYPDWEDGTICSVYEVFLPDGGIEVDDSDCQGIVLFPGDTGSCVIYNTRLYEGIPTLSQYGLALMALLMLGVGFIGFRRFV